MKLGNKTASLRENTCETKKDKLSYLFYLFYSYFILR